MKTIAFHNRYGFGGNALFAQTEAPIGDGLLAPFVALRKAAEAIGVRLMTLDMIPSDQFRDLDGIVFVDMPYPNDALGMSALEAYAPKYLITFEPPTVLSANWENLERFAKVFTWSDSLVSMDENFVKLNYANEFPAEMPRNPRTQFACMFASNKSSAFPVNLYIERQRTIDWFERNQREKFDLFGPGWDGRKLRTYYGVVPPGCKRAVMKNYRFAICYENGIFPGYITEKIFDCFAAGTIPVYWGAPNVGDYIPRECYIDRRGFKSHDELYRYLSTMAPAEFKLRLDAIEAFMKSESARPFTVERFVQTILGVIV